jgi:RimJ/RimL family protein N-acetyltransferase
MILRVVTTIERINPSQWRLLRDLRLSALLDSPDAFGQSYEDAVRQPEAEWKQTAEAASQGDRRVWFIARNEAGEAVGVVQARRRPPDDCLLFSMWVAPAARLSGAGRTLVDAVAHWGASWGARRVVLWVVAGNEPAMRFYDRIGFHIQREGPDAESGYAYGAIAMERPMASGDTQR